MSGSAYVLVERLGEGLARIRSERFGIQLFTRIRIRGADKPCAGCQLPIPRRTTAWSPLTNLDNRRHRLCARCLEAMTAQARSRHVRPVSDEHP